MRLYMGTVNTMGREDFTAAYGALFEGSPWIAEQAWHHRPFASFKDLFRSMEEVVWAAGEEQQLALLRAHPDLGGSIPMTANSADEQRQAGLHQLSEAERLELLALNTQYRVKFGFPFIAAVKGMNKGQIIELMKARLPRQLEEEKKAALQEVCRIAGYRFEQTLQNQTSRK